MAMATRALAGLLISALAVVGTAQSSPGACVDGGIVLMPGGSAGGKITGGASNGVLAGPAQIVCTWLVGSSGANTTLSDLRVNGDPVSTTVAIYGAYLLCGVGARDPARTNPQAQHSVCTCLYSVERFCVRFMLDS